ncbi:protein-disulfide reductase DsbD family protein [SAR86 cluster bacterium]|jgi:thiol:disulfide interchange protein DsbD|nr:protein-disulfide reductase DsbD family protein [SAR86 cluster bacterium]|tara:strand:- start:321 stop:698 length:378 start_codon:yes stop_codon:yes gene_type:complete
MTFSMHLSSTALLGERPPSADEAIKLFIENEEDQVTINFQLFEGVYLYKNKIKIYEGTTNYSFELDGSITNIEDDFFGYQPVLNEDFNISFKLLDTVPRKNIYIEYQGCFDNSYCYKKEEKKINL